MSNKGFRSDDLSTRINYNFKMGTFTHSNFFAKLATIISSALFLFAPLSMLLEELSLSIISSYCFLLWICAVFSVKSMVSLVIQHLEVVEMGLWFNKN
jgi:hypothetical protein